MIRKIFRKLIKIYNEESIESYDSSKFNIGRQSCFLIQKINPKKLSEVEFKVFSQFGEDGIIEFLVSKLNIKNKFFIEFGVENYNESNTRFLMMNRNWSGLIIDGSKKNIDYVKKRKYYWQYDLIAIHKFITKENINDLIKDNLPKHLVDDDIGILSVDIDGMDYWVLSEIECIRPNIIICEYNSLFKNDRPLTVPYQENFTRFNSHYSGVYYGANLMAFSSLLSKKGYKYIGSNTQNENAFFVQNDLYDEYLSIILEKDNKFNISKVRESRNKEHKLNFLAFEDRLKEIGNLELFDLNKSRKIKIKNLT